MIPPMTYVWKEGALRPLGRFHNRAAQAFTEGEYYNIEVHEERSWRSHKHYFATIHDLWLNLPERAAMEPWAASAEHLRKYALIKTGWFTCKDTVVPTSAEAGRASAMLLARVPADDYQIIVAQKNVIREFTAKSQSARAMGKDDFQKSKDDVLTFIGQLIQGDAA